VRFETVHQLAPELAEPLSRARGVVFVDARTDGAPGVVSHERIVPGGGDAPVTHALTPRTLLLYAERLFGRAPPATLVGIGAAYFDHGDALSPQVEAALPEAVRQVRALTRGQA
jgi:hydrogenase maturation protease